LCWERFQNGTSVCPKKGLDSSLGGIGSAVTWYELLFYKLRPVIGQSQELAGGMTGNTASKCSYLHALMRSILILSPVDRLHIYGHLRNAGKRGPFPGGSSIMAILTIPDLFFLKHSK